MRKRDLALLGLSFAALLVLVSPVLLRPGLAFFNFGDLYGYHHPMRHLVALRLQGGELPFWNPHIFGGLPLLANPQAAVFYPLSVLHHILPLPYAFTVQDALHLGLALFGMAALGRSSGLSGWLSHLLAASFGLGSYLVYRIPQGVPTLAGSLCYVPWCWLALQSDRRGLLAGVLGLQLLSGHPQFLGINLVGMALWVLLRWRGRAAYLASELFWTLLLAAVQWAPTAEFLGQSNRTAWPKLFLEAYSMPWEAYGSLLLPNLRGNPMDSTTALLPSVFFETRGLYAGWWVVPAALAALALGGLRRTWTLLLLGGAGAFLALGGANPFFEFLADLPVLGMVRTPARYAFLFLWAALLLAGQGGRRLAGRYRPGLRLKVLALVLVWADLLAWDRKFVRPQDPAPYLQPRFERIAALQGKPARVLTDPDFANPNKVMLYGLWNVNGYEAFFLDRFVGYAYRSEGRAAADPSRSYLRDYRSSLMSRLGVRNFIREDRVLENPSAYPLAYYAASPARPFRAPAPVLLRNDPEHWSVEIGARPSSGADFLVFAQPHYPGWRAWVDGEERRPALWDGFLQAVSLPAALPLPPEEKVHLRFRPTLWGLLCLLTGAGLGGWAARVLGGVCEPQ